MSALAPELQPDAAGVLATLARWFGARAAEDTSPLPAIDAAMDRLLAAGAAPIVAETLVALGGIRTSLSQHPGFFALTEPASGA